MKKGFVGVDMVQWFIRLMFLTIVVFTCVFLIRMYITNEVNILDAEMDLFAKRFLYSPNGLAYMDERINRVYPGIIDIGKFQDGKNIVQEMVDYGDPNNYMAAKFSLDGVNVEPFYYNVNGYHKWKPLSNLKIKGPGGAVSSEKVYPVLVYDDGKYYSSKLMIDVVTPKS